MTQEPTQSGPDTAETDRGITNGLEGMAQKMEQCGCCGNVMEKMKSFMPAMCREFSDGGEGKAETDAETETEDQTGGTAGRG